MSVKTDTKITQYLAKVEADEKARQDRAEKAKLVEAWLASLPAPERYLWNWRARRSLPPTEGHLAALTAFLRR